jgi:hypothetical protein
MLVQIQPLLPDWSLDMAKDIDGTPLQVGDVVVRMRSITYVKEGTVGVVKNIPDSATVEVLANGKTPRTYSNRWRLVSRGEGRYI